MKYPKEFEAWWKKNTPKPMYHVPFTGMLVDMEPFKEIAFKGWKGGKSFVKKIVLENIERLFPDV